jgi:D-alanyl-D-alanine dipeptidase
MNRHLLQHLIDWKEWLKNTMKKILLLGLGLMTIFNCYAKEKITLIADPTVLAIPIHENHEPMVDIVNQKEISYGPPPLLPDNTNYTKVRKTIYDKLKQAQAMLPDGLKFRLYEGYRSLELQQHIFEERYTKLQKEHPKLTHQQIFIESTKFVSPVVNLDGSKNIPPHATGAAIDVYLIDKDGNVVDMGIHLDDTYNDLKGTFCKTDSQAISEKAKQYRKIMGKTLEAVGFVNYPTEYWHWSYGDRYWAHQTRQPFAIYGTV